MQFLPIFEQIEFTSITKPKIILNRNSVLHVRHRSPGDNFQNFFDIFWSTAYSETALAEGSLSIRIYNSHFSHSKKERLYC